MGISFFHAAVISGTPLLFAIIGEILTEKSGELNLGVEGMMLIGAVFGFAVGYSTGNPVLAMFGAMGAGAAAGMIFAFLTVTLKANQTVTGLTLTIFGTGVSSYAGKSFVGNILPDSVKLFFTDIRLPLLGDIPFIGPVFFRQGIFVYLGYVAAVVATIYIFKTRIGLNLRAVGENSAAADASGISVSLYKYVHVMLGGAFAGLGGAYLSLAYVPAWQENITAGRGWIAVALVIFCKWNPLYVLFGAFIFGGLDIIGFRLQKFENLNISQYVVDMMPYFVTIFIIVLTSIKKKRESMPPAALGIPYFREER